MKKTMKRKGKFVRIYHYGAPYGWEWRWDEEKKSSSKETK